MKSILELTVKKGSKVLSGRSEGEKMRKQLKLDIRDDDKETYEIRVPELFAITASYFLACFGISVRKLGKDGFNNKYRFVTSQNSIKKNIATGIEGSLNIDLPF